MRRIEYIAHLAFGAGPTKNHLLSTNPVDQINVERLIVAITVIFVALIVGIGTLVAVRSRQAARTPGDDVHFSPLAFSPEAAPDGDLLEAVRLINNENLAVVAGNGMSPERLTEMVHAIAAPRSRESRTHDN